MSHLPLLVTDTYIMPLRLQLAQTLSAHIDPSLDLAMALSAAAMEGPHASGSWADSVTTAQSEFEFGAMGSAPLSQALSELPLTMASGVDHMSALVDALASERTIGYALATIARGAIEAYGRAWFLLEAHDATSLAKRWLRTRNSDLRFAVRIADDPSDVTRMESSLAAIREDAASLGMTTNDLRLSFADLASEVYNAAHGDNEGQRAYSVLSAVAHAERSGVQRMVHRIQNNVAPGLHLSKLEASDEFVTEVVGEALKVHSFVFVQSMQKFGLQAEDHMLWAASISAAAERLGEAEEA